MYLPPLGGFDLKTVQTCFDIMEDFNHNPDVSRIENIEEPDLKFFSLNKFRTYEKAKEYIVAQKEMASLSGGKFRHKRNLYNFFIKHYGGRLRDYEKKDQGAVLDVYRAWMNERLSKNSEAIYKAMLQDSYKVFSEMLANWHHFNMVAKVVECDGKTKAFTSGFHIHQSMFCINFEIADLSLKGLAPFIFCEFSKTLGSYPDINIMDDSGIENIRQSKLSYRPIKSVASYTVLNKQN